MWHWTLFLTDAGSQVPEITCWAYITATVLASLQSVLAKMLHSTLSRQHRGPKRCRRIRGRGYKHSRGRRSGQSQQRCWRRRWARTRKVRNRLARATNGNGVQPQASLTHDATAPDDCTQASMEIDSSASNVGQAEAAPSNEASTANQMRLGEPVSRMTIDERAKVLGQAAVPIPGDGWCLLHAVSWYLQRHEGDEVAWCVRKAAETYVQALEWLINLEDPTIHKGHLYLQMTLFSTERCHW